MPPTPTAAHDRQGRPPAAAGEGRNSPCPREFLLSDRRSSRRSPAPGAATLGSRALWWALITRSRGRDGERSLLAVNSDEFPDGTPVDATSVVDGERRPAGWVVDVRYRSGNGAPLHVSVAPAVAAHDVQLWFVALHDGSALLPAASLVAFIGAGVPAGSLLSLHEVPAPALRQAARVGEIRWYPRSGVVDTVVVDEAARGRGIARHLVTAAEGLRGLWGWPPLRSDGRLTDDGAGWLTHSPEWWWPRLVARTERLPGESDARPDPRGVARLLTR
jgi:GNAT superfamily N-acetyltransferase